MISSYSHPKLKIVNFLIGKFLICATLNFPSVGVGANQCIDVLKNVQFSESEALSLGVLNGRADPNSPENLSQAYKAVELAIENYRKRRGWTEELYQKLRKIVSTDMHRSIYYNVTDASQSGNPVVGSLRLIAAPYVVIKSSVSGEHVVSFEGLTNFIRNFEFAGLETLAKRFPPMQLPMEHILGIQLPRESQGVGYSARTQNETFTFTLGMIIEPGNFVVDHTHPRREEILLMLYEKLAETHYTESAFTPGFTIALSMNKPTYFTYGDATSVRMYRRLGFTQLNVQGQGELSNVLQAAPKDMEREFLRLPETMHIDKELFKKYEHIFRNYLQTHREFFFWTLQDFWRPGE